MVRCPQCNKKIPHDYIDLVWQPDFIDLLLQPSDWHKFHCRNCRVKLKVKKNIYYLWILLFRLAAFLFLGLGIYSVPHLLNFLHPHLSNFYLIQLVYLFLIILIICGIFWFFLFLYSAPYRGRVYLAEAEAKK